MRKPITAALAALTVVASMAAAAAPAAAQSRYDHNRRGNDNSAAIVAGIAGLAIGAALASSNRGASYDSYGYNRAPAYGYGYNRAPSYSYGYGRAPAYSSGYGYGSGARYAPSYRVCERTERVRDPRTGRRVLVRSQYAC